MKKILIFGAGSIGNHMTYASLKLGHQVFVTDISSVALKRMKNQVYPSRYGKWNKNINIVNYKDTKNLSIFFDLVIIGTPPATHLKVFELVKKKLKFKKILIEKPLCSINEKNLAPLIKCKTQKIFVGYNHSISKSFLYFLKKIQKIKKKDINEIYVNWCENWIGILKAHFWLKNENHSYLGNFKNGGGSLQEHSHGFHISFIISKILKLSFFQKLKCIMLKDVSNKYDKSTQISSYNDNILFKYHTNLTTFPAKKNVIFCTKNKIFEWHCNFKANNDIVKIVSLSNNKVVIKKFKKTRSSEFENEIDHILRCNESSYKKSNINIQTGIQTQKYINKLEKYFYEKK